MSGLFPEDPVYNYRSYVQYKTNLVDKDGWGVHIYRVTMLHHAQDLSSKLAREVMNWEDVPSSFPFFDKNESFRSIINYFKEISSFQDDHCQLHLMFDDRGFAGFGVLATYQSNYSLDEGSALMSRYIRPDLQGKGLGTQLTSYLVEVCQNIEGVVRILAEVDRTNIASMRSNNKAGFDILPHNTLSPKDENFLLMCRNLHE